MSAVPRLLVVLPCYNEERAITGVLDDIAALGAGYDTIVIDDGSKDRTYETAKSRSACIRLPRNLGIGSAVQTGLKYAARERYDFCVQIDGDGQHPPAEIATLLEAHRQRPANLIIGSRYLENGGFTSSFARRFGSRVIALALRLFMAGARTTDPTSGLRLMDRRAIEFFARHYPHDFPEPISIAWAARAGLTIRDVPVAMRERRHGDSSIAGLGPLGYMVRVLGYVVLAALMKREPVASEKD